jgi:hypothetical protein
VPFTKSEKVDIKYYLKTYGHLEQFWAKEYLQDPAQNLCLTDYQAQMNLMKTYSIFFIYLIVYDLF